MPQGPARRRSRASLQLHPVTASLIGAHVDIDGSALAGRWIDDFQLVFAGGERDRARRADADGAELLAGEIDLAPRVAAVVLDGERDRAGRRRRRLERAEHARLLAADQ